ncbi:MAG: retron St85 family RNA-directed DNA polymerase [Thiolinea sp.]
MTMTWQQRWEAIEKAGGMNAYIRQQLNERGFMVARKSTDKMSAAALKRYKAELKKEAAEKRKIKQEAWKVYKATHIVHLGEGIYWHDEMAGDQWDLQDAEKRLLENNLPVLIKAPQLAEALELSISELRHLCYQREAATLTHYTRFEIPKRSGGNRAIWAPRPQLKQAQRWILDNILERLLVHGSAHGFLPGRSIASNAAQHSDSRVLVKMDIADFFPTVSWKRVRGVFRKAGYGEQIATLLALLCTESPREVIEDQGQTYFIAMGDRCLPQGAPTSPALTNALCLKLDRRLSGLAQKLGWRYTRYADDLAFSLPAKSKGEPAISQLLGSVHSIVCDEGFQVNAEKTRIIRQGRSQTVTGLVVNDKHGPRVNRKLKRQMRAAIHNLNQGKPLPEGESLQRLRGYAAYIAMTDRKLGMEMLQKLG